MWSPRSIAGVDSGPPETIRYVLVSCHLCESVPCDLFARRLLVSAVYAACSAYFVAINFIILTISYEEYN